MKRKKTDTVQLSKIRIREELRQKMAKDAERKAQSLNAEIVERLEDSYEWEAQKQVLEAQILELKSQMNKFLLEEIPDLKRTIAQAENTVKVINALTGNNPASYTLIQKVAVEATLNPEWNRSEEGRRSLADKIHAYIINSPYIKSPKEPSE